jgi:parallel beta-helix repeat protein
MFKKWINYGLIIVSAIFVGLAFYSPSQAANCGGSVPCACGDSVVANRTLVAGVDPIVGAACTGNGLVMNTAGVVLDLNGNGLHGSGKGAGVLINGVNGVTIESGLIFNFEMGISTGSSTTTGSTINEVKPDGNVIDGIFLQGDGNEVIAILAKRNGNNGVTVIGDGNTLQGHNDEYNGFDGIRVEGNDNELIGNLASENAKKGSGNGITLIGHSNLLQRNRMTKLNINGIVITGNENELIENQVTKQSDDGIVVDGNNNVLTNNRVIENAGVGIVVQGTGDAAASKGNTVRKNRGKPQCSIYGVTTPPTCIQK